MIPKKNICVILRGHIRDSFMNDGLYIFLKKLQEVANIDIYIYTWLNIEAAPGCSWRQLPVTTEQTSMEKIYKYFRDIQIKHLTIKDENEIILIGDYIGKIASTSKKGWKNMWYGIHNAYEIIKESYDTIVNTRLDFFGPYIYNRYYKLFRNDFFINFSISNHDNKIKFYYNNEVCGIDNFYIGDLLSLKLLTNHFHNNMYETIKKLDKTNHQEFYVYRLAKSMTDFI